jgi:hypothetical protein
MVRTKGKTKRRHQEWFDAECFQKKKSVQKFLRQFQRAKADRNEKRLKYVTERREYKQLMREKKAQYDRARLEKLENSAKDPKLFRQTIRSVNRKSLIYNSISTENWFDHFSNLFNDFANADDGGEEETEVEDGDHEPIFNDPISRQEVITSIGNLKSGKSAGPDRVIGELLNHASDRVADFSVTLFNRIFESGTFPLEWSK